MLILDLNSEFQNDIDGNISQQCHCLSQQMSLPMHSLWKEGSLLASLIWPCVDLIHMPQSFTQTLLYHDHICDVDTDMFLTE